MDGGDSSNCGFRRLQHQSSVVSGQLSVKASYSLRNWIPATATLVSTICGDQPRLCYSLRNWIPATATERQTRGHTHQVFVTLCETGLRRLQPGAPGLAMERVHGYSLRNWIPATATRGRGCHFWNGFMVTVSETGFRRLQPTPGEPAARSHCSVPRPEVLANRFSARNPRAFAKTITPEPPARPASELSGAVEDHLLQFTEPPIFANRFSG